MDYLTGSDTNTLKIPYVFVKSMTTESENLF